MNEIKCYLQSEQEMLEKQFSCGGVDVVCRLDYESLPIPMKASEFTDEQMQELANTIYNTLQVVYGFDSNELKEYFTKGEGEKCSMRFWEEMETIAVSMGMAYYEDEEN